MYFKPFAMPQPRKPKKSSPKKRPPLEWDGNKPLKWPIAIYYKGKCFLEVTRYSTIDGWFQTKYDDYRDCSFIVQRIA